MYNKALSTDVIVDGSSLTEAAIPLTAATNPLSPEGEYIEGPFDVLFM